MGLRNLLCCTLLGLVATVTGQEPAAAPELLAAVREGDTAKVGALLQAGADANARDASGATALMHATAFGTTSVMQLLLDRGADARAADKAGATALMWGTYDVARVRMLLAGGADANAARPDGLTPLASAALRGRTDVMDVLLAAGADRARGRLVTPWPMTLPQVARTTNDAAMRDLAARWEPALPKAPTTAGPLPLAAWILTSTLSWRPQPEPGSLGIVKTLLDAGADPNETVPQMALVAPALFRIARWGDIETMRLMLERGADPNTTASGGMTPLMMAAVTDPRPAMVRLLLDKGASVAARDANGQTALDYALRLGDTDTSRVLRAAGAVEGAPARVPPPAVSTPLTPRAAMETALARLQPAAVTFSSKTKCISCHNHSLPALAVKLADAKGVRIDRALASHPTEASIAMWSTNREHMLVGNCLVPGFLANVTYGLFGMAEEHVPSSPVTDAVMSCLIGLQKPDGSWEGGDSRPPLSARLPIVYTALAARALRVYGPPGRVDDTRTRVARALAFLRTAPAADTQDEAFRLLGLIWAGGTRAEVADQRRKVLQLQRPDGGWGQMPSMPPDAYATGQAMYAAASSGMATSSVTYRQGAAFLLRTQRADGTWHVRTRAIGFQPFVDSGFPHGPDQFISAAATSWAVMALSFVR